MQYEISSGTNAKQQAQDDLQDFNKGQTSFVLLFNTDYEQKMRNTNSNQYNNIKKPPNRETGGFRLSSESSSIFI